MKKITLLLLFTTQAFLAQTVIVDNPANLPIGDTHANLSHEAFRFGTETYGYSADSFTLSEETTLLTADFFGEVILSFYSSLPAFSVYIFENAPNNEPNGNPNLDTALVHLEQIQLGAGVDVIFESGDDNYDVRVNFTLANNGVPIVLPAGDYWIIAAAYGEDADAGDPTLSWTWRFSSNVSTFVPKYITNQFNNPIWEPIGNSPNIATSMAWLLKGNVNLSITEFEQDKISIYPNPSNGILNIKTPKNIEITNISVYEMNGKRIKLENLTDNTFDISNLQQGVYLLELQTTKGIIHRKIVRN